MIRHSVEGHRARDSKCTSAVCAESMSSVDDALPIVDAGEWRHEQLVYNTPTDT